jgi:hypothetical protein
VKIILERGGLKIGKEGVSIDAAVAAAAVSVQSESPPVDNSLTTGDAEADQKLASAKRVGMSVVLREQEDRIRADLQTLKISDTPKEAIDVLVRNLAAYQLYHAAERLYRLIFGSQLSALKEMNLLGPMNRDKLREFYDAAAANFPQIYDKYPFEAYLGFLRTNRLITSNDDINFAITNLGREFLQWMVAEGIADTKPF